MPRDPYTDYAPPRSAQRWDDADRFANERGDRPRDRDFERFDDRGPARPSRRARDHSASSDEFVDRRGPPSRAAYEDDYVREREREVYRDEPPRDLPVRSRTTVEREVEREREYYRDPSPERERVRRPVRPVRPTMLRRQSSLDTFDRKPTMPRYMQREEAGPVAVRREREVEEERAYPAERVREREVVRERRRSRSRSLSSTSSSEYSLASSVRTGKSQFPKRGKTRMPARMVSKRAIIELGYPFVEEVSVVLSCPWRGGERERKLTLRRTRRLLSRKLLGANTSMRFSSSARNIGERLVGRVLTSPFPTNPHPPTCFNLPSLLIPRTQSHVSPH